MDIVGGVDGVLQHEGEVERSPRALQGGDGGRPVEQRRQLLGRRGMES